MKAKERAVQIKRIRRFAKKWYSPLRLFEWDIVWKYVDGTLIVDGDQSENAAAATSADWRYRHATIQWNLEIVAEQTDAMLEKIVFHEIMHLHLNEMREAHPDHEERVAETLALCFSAIARGVRKWSG